MQVSSFCRTLVLVAVVLANIGCQSQRPLKRTQSSDSIPPKTPPSDFTWVKMLGRGHGLSIAIDSAENAYLTGRHTSVFYTYGPDYDVGKYGISLPVRREYAVFRWFLSKHDSEGTLLWTKQAKAFSIGSPQPVVISGISNSVYIAWTFEGTESFGDMVVESHKGANIFLAKLDGDGGLVWARQFGGDKGAVLAALTADHSGNVYVAGLFDGHLWREREDRPCTSFLAKTDGNGNVVWTKEFGATTAQINAIAVDRMGIIHLTGSFTDTSTFGETKLTSLGKGDIFVAKLDSAGNFLWATQAGGSKGDSGASLAVDAEGNIYVTGHFNAGFTFGKARFGAVTLRVRAGQHVFVCKLDKDGHFIWARKAWGRYRDFGCCIAVDDAGNVYMAAHFQGTATLGEKVLRAPSFFGLMPQTQTVVAKMDGEGNLLWVKQAISVFSAGLFSSIALGPAGNVYVIGSLFDNAVGFDVYFAKVSNRGLDGRFIAPDRRKIGVEL